MPDETDQAVHLTICATCTDTSQSGEAGVGAGAGLLAKFEDALEQQPDRHNILLTAQRCLMACTEGCIASIASKGKMQYLLGRLKADDALVEQTLDFIRLYDAAPTGVTQNHEWPPMLAMHFLGRIPPIDPVDADWRDDGCNL